MALFPHSSSGLAGGYNASPKGVHTDHGSPTLTRGEGDVLEPPRGAWETAGLASA